jgi:hypothetical protein
LKPELPIMIRDYKDPILFKESYNSSKDSILKKIKKFFDNFPQSRIKFNLFITHKINNFLIKETKESGLSKSEIIRNIINDFIDKSSRK